MATLYRELRVNASAESVWSAVRDVGAVHTRLGPGFVVDCRLDGDARIVTFGNGMVVREPIVTIDDVRRRLAYAAQSQRASHYAASMQVFDEGPGQSRLVWIIDVLPDSMAQPIAMMVEQGERAMKACLEAARAAH